MHFKNMDTDNDGFISIDDLKRSFTDLKEHFLTADQIQGMCERIFMIADTDENNLLTLKEFLGVYTDAEKAMEVMESKWAVKKTGYKGDTGTDIKQSSRGDRAMSLDGPGVEMTGKQRPAAIGV